MLGVLYGNPHSEGPDSWSWKYSADRIYSVKIVHVHLSNVNLAEHNIAAGLSHIMALAWNSWALCKVHVFSWQLLLDKIATRMNILSHCVLRDQDASLCALWCGSGNC